MQVILPIIAVFANVLSVSVETRFSLWGFSCLGAIDREKRPWECPQTDLHQDSFTPP